MRDKKQNGVVTNGGPALKSKLYFVEWQLRECFILAGTCKYMKTTKMKCKCLPGCSSSPSGCGCDD